MKLLFLGDVVAKAGRNAVIEILPSLQEKYEIDFTIVNAENAAHGKGITPKIYNALKNAGVDVITLGNHAFSKDCILKKIDSCKDMVRPLNMDPLGLGQHVVVRECKGKKIAVTNLLGNIFIENAHGNAFNAMDKILDNTEADIYILDFHAEATGEKEIMFELFKDRLTAVLGTHTHVQTADEKIDSGCAYMTDVGMCGPYHSILGRDVQEVLTRSVYGEKTHYTPADTAAVICGCVITIDEETNRAVDIERIQIRPE